MRIITRPEWGARAPKHRVGLTRSEGMFTHYTAGPRARNRSEGIARTQSVQRFHQDSRGWADIAYSFIIDDAGNIYQGRGWGVAGGHTAGWNSRSHAACVHLNANDEPTVASLQALRWLHEEHDRRFGSGFHLPHRSVASTACAGNPLSHFTLNGMHVPTPAPVGPPPTVDLSGLRRWIAGIARANLILVGGALLSRGRAGMSRGHVKALQDALNIVTGTRLVVDGDFGPATDSALRNFQRFFGLAADGIAGHATKLTLLYVLEQINLGRA